MALLHSLKGYKIQRKMSICINRICKSDFTLLEIDFYHDRNCRNEPTARIVSQILSFL